MGEVPLGPEDQVLQSLFANEEEEQDHGQEQQKQAAHNTRTASRTVGTRPTNGVGRVGGPSAGSSSSKSSEIDTLSSLWTSAPDVSGVFGMKPR